MAARQTPSPHTLTSGLGRLRVANWLATLAAVAATTAALLLLRARLSTQVVALLYLLPVMLSATRWGLLPALMASLVAFFAFNYFFIPPTHTLVVGDPQELLALVVFFIVAVLISQSVGAANLQAAQARARELEATALYTLTKSLNVQASLEETLANIARQVVEAFDLAGCEIVLAAAPNAHPAPLRYYREADTPRGQTLDIPLATQQGTLGVLCLSLHPQVQELKPATRQSLTTFAVQLGLFVERVRLAREAERTRLLEESDQMKSALLSSVSHDLRTPLSAIKASATVLLQQDVALDAAARYDLLSAINEETDRLNRLVGDLLDMSRIEAGALRLKREWFELDELVRDVARRLSARAETFQFHFNWPPALPLVHADYVQIDRLITNLLENASRFTPPGAVIEVAAQAADGQMTAAVTNPGPAIPAQMQAHLFDKFYRISDERAPGMGTGLGLSICKGIVEAHGGRIWVQSPVEGDSGARFVFTLPLPPDAPQPTLPNVE